MLTAEFPAPAAPPVPVRIRAAHRVDFDYLERVAGGDATYVVLMARLFCAHFPEQMFVVEVAALQGDATALRRGLERLATTCQLLGLPRLVLLAHQLAARLAGPPAGPLPNAAAVLRQLRKCGTATMRTLAEQLQGRYPAALAGLLEPG